MMVVIASDTEPKAFVLLVIDLKDSPLGLQKPKLQGISHWGDSGENPTLTQACALWALHIWGISLCVNTWEHLRDQEW